MTYTKSAHWYDIIHGWKDYHAEAEQLRRWIQQYTGGSAKTLLDVGCGTGVHLRHLAEHFTCEGIDLSADQIAVAREQLPEATFHIDDMRTFSLGKAFDAIIVLFGSIGYVSSIDELNRTVANMAQHLNAGGVLIIEPWIHPDAWKTNRASATFVDERDLKIARMNDNKVDGRTSIMDVHYLISTPEGVEYFTEHHEMMLLTDEEYMAAFESCGLNVTHLPQGLTGRGTYIGIRYS